MTWLAQIIAVVGPENVMSGMIAILTSAMWMRLEHRLTVIETSCKRCNEHTKK